VPQRAGVWNAMKRMMGMPVLSTLEILITPSVLPPPMFSYPTLQATAQPYPKEKITPAHPLLTETNKLTLLLPPNIVLPTSSLSIVGMYRVMLVKSYQVILSLGCSVISVAFSYLCGYFSSLMPYWL
jgi:hypothetical protein